MTPSTPHATPTAPDRPDLGELPAIGAEDCRDGVCDLCYRQRPVAAIATVHQATLPGWSVMACLECVTDDGEVGRRVRFLRLEDAAQTRLVHEIHANRSAARRER